MIKWILQDTKRNLKTKKSFILFIVTLLAVFSFILNDSQQHDEDFNQDDFMNEILNPDKINKALKFSMFVGYNCYYEVDAEDSCASNDAFDRHIKLMEEELDETEFNMQLLHLYDSATDGFLAYYDESPDSFKLALDRMSVNINDFRNIKNDLKVKNEGKYETIIFENLYVEDVSLFNVLSIEAQELYFNTIHGYPDDVSEILSSGFFMARFLTEQYFLLILITILVVYDSFYRDYKSGVFKTILSSPTKRFRYIFVKTMSSTLSIFILVLSPLLIGVICLNITVGYNTLNYPIYASKTTYNSFTPALRHTRFLNEVKTVDYYSKYQDICRFGPVSQFPYDLSGAGYETVVNCATARPRFFTLQIIPLSKFLLSLALISVLIIIFIASLNTLFSLIMDSPILNLSVLLTTLIASGLLNKVLIGTSILKLSPFTFLNPAALIFGTLPYTYLNGIITLSVWIVIISVINYYISKNKDFAY